MGKRKAPAGATQLPRKAARTDDADAEISDDGQDLMQLAQAMVDDGDDGSGDEDSDEADVVPARPSTSAGKQRRAPPDAVQSLRNDAALLAQRPRLAGIELQCDELLRSVRVPSPSSSKSATLGTFLERLQKKLLKLPARPAVSVVEALRTTPFPNAPANPSKLQWKLAFEAPSAVTVVGSRATGTVCRWKGTEGWAVDVAVQMPAEKDVKDHRYFHKRSFYVAVLASQLRASKLDVEVSLGTLHGDERKPIVELRPRAGADDATGLGKLRGVIRLLPTYVLADVPFSITRLEATKSNVRIRTGAEDVPTPSYNTAILIDGMIGPTAAHLQVAAKRCAAFVDAAIMLKVWAHQRGLPAEHGLSSVGFVLSMILAHLVSPAGNRSDWRLPASSPAWALFKGAIEFLARSDLSTAPVYMAGSDVEAAKARFIGVPLPILVDPSGYINLLVDTPAATCKLLQAEAQATSRVLDGDTMLGFEAALIRNYASPSSRFDSIVSCGRSVGTRLTNNSIELPSQLPAAGPDASSPTSALLDRLSDVLVRALTDRITGLSICRSGTSVTLGFRVTPAEATRLVDLGPPAEDEAAVATFAAFWGDRSEMRRFKDGSIRQAVVWDAPTPLERTGLLGVIVRHVLSASPHFRLPADAIDVLDSMSYADLLREPASVRSGPASVEDPEARAFGGVLGAAEALGKTLRGLEGLPLGITGVASTSDTLRYTSPLVPGARRRKGLAGRPLSSQHVEVHELVITFESSGRWPDDLEAIQKVKAAMLARLGERLLATDTSSGVAQAEVAFDADAPKSADNVALEVLLRSGYAFRLRIHHDRERVLYERALAFPKVAPSAKRQASLGLDLHNGRFVVSPRHHNAVLAVHHRYGGYALAVRLLKRWLAAHMLLPLHVKPAWVELVVAAVFVGSSDDARPRPATGSAGFARALERLRDWRWREEPLLVPIYSAAAAPELSARGVEVPSHVRDQALKAFADQRRSDPAIHSAAMIIATEADPIGRRDAPDRMIAARIQVLAIATLDALARGGAGMDVRALFVTPLEHFDFVLRLDRRQLPRYAQAIAPELRVLGGKSTEAVVNEDAPILLGFDPAAAFVARAQQLHTDAVVLFHDGYGGDVVGGLFQPSLLASTREWRPHFAFACEPAGAVAAGGEDEEASKRHVVALDREAVLAGLCRLANGLVTAVELKGR